MKVLSYMHLYMTQGGSPYNRPVVEKAPLQLYCSTLAFAPQISIVRNKFDKDIPHWITTTCFKRRTPASSATATGKTQALPLPMPPHRLLARRVSRIRYFPSLHVEVRIHYHPLLSSLLFHFFACCHLSSITLRQSSVAWFKSLLSCCRSASCLKHHRYAIAALALLAHTTFVSDSRRSCLWVLSQALSEVILPRVAPKK